MRVSLINAHRNPRISGIERHIVISYKDKVINAQTSGERAYYLEQYTRDLARKPGMPVYAPANTEREQWFVPAQRHGHLTHLVTNNQTYGQMYFRTICNRTIHVDDLEFVNPDQSLMCEQCVTIENIWAENAD